jgi:DNA-binding IclR family transcriptional regulator
MVRAGLVEGGGEPAEIQAVSRAAQILGLFGPQLPELSAADAAERLGLNRSTAYRYCTSLVAAGLLERGAQSGTFVPGGLLVQLGTFALGRRKVMDLAAPHLRSLSASTRLTAVLSLWGSGCPVVSRVEEDSNRTSMVTVRVGTHLHLDTAQAKVFLAYLPDRARLLGNLPDGQRAAVVDELTRVRAAGYGAVVTTDGIVAVGAPAYDEHGICATVAVVGTERSLSCEPHSDAVRMVIDAARALSKEMGVEHPSR